MIFCPGSEVSSSQGRCRLREWYRLSVNALESQSAIRRLIAGVLALSGFMIALLAGMQAGNQTSKIVLTALGAMIVCHIVGTLLGLVAESVLSEHRRAMSASSESEPEIAAANPVIEAVEVVEDSVVQAAA